VSDDFRASIGLEPIIVAEPQAQQIVPPRVASRNLSASKIGTRLEKIFHDKWGPIPCGVCKEAIRDLNGLTVGEVSTDRERWVKSITANAAKAAPKYWQRLAITANEFLHVGGVEYLIGRYIDEALAAEDAANAAIKQG
jgi:hypothetical protein